MAAAAELCDKIDEHNRRLNQAILLAVSFGRIDGAHHKAWLIDQMVRTLAGDHYEEIVRNACSGADGANTYTWDIGIPP
jgi:hypothetical protein